MKRLTFSLLITLKMDKSLREVNVQTPSLVLSYDELYHYYCVITVFLGMWHLTHILSKNIESCSNNLFKQDAMWHTVLKDKVECNVNFIFQYCVPHSFLRVVTVPKVCKEANKINTLCYKYTTLTLAAWSRQSVESKLYRLCPPLNGTTKLTIC